MPSSTVCCGNADGVPRHLEAIPENGTDGGAPPDGAPAVTYVFTVTTLLISIPIAELCFVYIATLYGGSITFTTPMLWALAFVAEFLIGGVTGIYLGASAAVIAPA